MKILLLEPYYKRDLPPLSFMKLATYHKAGGDEVRYHRGDIGLLDYKPDIVYITAPFTWNYEAVKTSLIQALKFYPEAKVFLGGNCASLMETKFREEVKGNYEIIKGLFKDIETLEPDYDLFNLDYVIGFTTRGCCNKCDWCMVWRLEPEFKAIEDWENCLKPRFLNKPHKVNKILLMDNNFLASDLEHIKKVIQRLKTYNRPVDFNQGLDVALFKDEKAEAFRGLNIHPLRFSWDSKRVEKVVVEGLKKAMSLNLRDIAIYVLYNFKDTPEEIYERLRTLASFGSNVMIFLMRYQPLDTFEKGDYIGENWSEEMHKNLSRLRNPFANGVLRFDNVEHFERAFGHSKERFKEMLKTGNATQFNPSNNTLDRFF